MQQSRQNPSCYTSSKLRFDDSLFHSHSLNWLSERENRIMPLLLLIFINTAATVKSIDDLQVTMRDGGVGWGWMEASRFCVAVPYFLCDGGAVWLRWWFGGNYPQAIINALSPSQPSIRLVATNGQYIQKLQTCIYSSQSLVLVRQDRPAIHSLGPVKSLGPIHVCLLLPGRWTWGTNML